MKQGGWKVLWNVLIPVYLLGLLRGDSVGLLVRAVLCCASGWDALPL